MSLTARIEADRTRRHRMRRIRRLIAVGTYETSQKLSIAADRLLDQLAAPTPDATPTSAPSLPDHFACNDPDGLG